MKESLGTWPTPNRPTPTHRLSGRFNPGRGVPPHRVVAAPGVRRVEALGLHGRPDGSRPVDAAGLFNGPVRGPNPVTVQQGGAFMNLKVWVFGQ